MPAPAFSKPVDALAVEGEVVILGNICSETRTPEAALESAERIRNAAEEAIKAREQAPVHPSVPER